MKVDGVEVYGRWNVNESAIARLGQEDLTGPCDRRFVDAVRWLTESV